MALERRLVHAQAGVRCHVRVRRELVSSRDGPARRKNPHEAGEPSLHVGAVTQDRYVYVSQ